jgi:predicted ester cyclase
MNLVSVESKQLIKDYLKALSGQPKSEALVNHYVSDPDLKEHIRQAEAAFPGYELIPQQMIAEGDVVAARCTFRGIHHGDFAGVPSTGRSVSSNFMIFYRVADGLIVEHWIQLDIHDIVSQLTA